MNDRKFQQMAELVGVLLCVAVFGFAFLVALVTGHVRGSTSSDTSQVPSPATRSIFPPARTPAPPMTGMGGGEEGGAVLSAQTIGTPASTTSPAPSSTPTVIVSALAPPATAVTSPRTVATIEPVSNTLEAQVRAAVEANFPPSEWATAMAIAYRESRYQPWAVEPGGQHFGVFQVDPSLHGAVPSDIAGQVAQAAALWRRAGWQPWSVQ